MNEETRNAYLKEIEELERLVKSEERKLMKMKRNINEE